MLWLALVHWGATTGLDRSLMLQVRAAALAGPDWLATGFGWLSWIGNADQRTPAILLAALALYLWGQRRAAIALPLAAFASTLTANGIIKPVLGRARPDIVPWWTAADGYSLPSGHATGSLAFLLIIWLLTRQLDTGPLRSALRACAVLLVVGMGLSRVWLGVHWPSDILAGWLWGGAFALAALRWSQPSQPGVVQHPR